MIKKEELHILIHSLSKSEKRYFRLFCTREASGNNYLKLFDSIDGQEVYDEKTIKEQFKGQKFVVQLHVTKNYLKKLILKSLRNFHANISKDAELKDILRNIEILFNKELYEHCRAEVVRAEAVARKYELLTGLMEVENWKRKLEQNSHPHHYAFFRAVAESKEKTLHLLENVNSYWRLAADFSEAGYSLRRPVASFNPLPDKPDIALTLEAKSLHYSLAYLWYIRNEENELAERQLQTLIDIFEADPDRMREEPGLYVSTLNNLLSFQVFNKKYEKAMEMIQKAKDIYNSWNVTSENRTLLKQILRTYNIEMEIYRDTKKFNEKTEFIENTEAFIKANVYKIPKEYLLSFSFQLANIHFMRKEFGRSLRWVNQILNARFGPLRADLQIQARFLNLMIHFEQKNLMVLRYYVDSTRRFMKKMGAAEPFQEVLLKFFVKIGRLPLLEYRKAFAQLGERLFPPNGSSLVPKNMEGYIDYREWIAANT